MSPGPTVHVAQIGLFEDPKGRPPAELLEAWPTMVDIAEAAATSGSRVSVLQVAGQPAQLARNGVTYYFVPRERGGARGLAALFKCIAGLAPDVLHVSGLEFPREVLALAAAHPGPALLLQDHASQLPRPWRRRLWRRSLGAARGIAFCAREQALPFLRAGLMSPATQVFEIPESTSRFEPGDSLEARRATGIYGEPAVLWVGHLDANKDPLTLLAGVAIAAAALPRLELWCCFGTAPLLQAVRERIEADSRLRGRVHLLGRFPHPRIELLMRAADCYVSASHREGSGYALIEALACGLTPAVTDIPSFRALTASGSIGRLWPPDNPAALAAALCGLARQSPESRIHVRRHFDAELSLSALGRKLRGMYETALQRGSGHLPAARASTG